MSKLRQAEVVVAGAGPVGLLAAVALAEQGVGVAVLDEVDRTAVHGYALALHPRSLELLDDLGMAGDLVEQGRRIETVAFYDGNERRAELRLDTLDSSFPFALSLSQPLLEEHLRQALARRGVKVLWSHRLAALEQGPGALHVSIDRLEHASAGYPVASVHQTVAARIDLEPEYLVASDGHRSTTRRLAGLPCDSIGPPRAFAVFELEAELEAPTEMRVMLGGSSLAALWPLPGNRCRLVFELDDVPQARADQRRQVVKLGASAYPEVAHDLLVQLVEAHAPWFGDVPEQVLWSVAIRFDPKLIKSLGSGRVWFAGDAAHVALPPGMHGMNLGLTEVSRLAQAIATALPGGSLPGGSGDDLLSSYAAGSMAEARRLLCPAEGFTVDPDADSWLRERLDRLVPCVPATGEHLDALLATIGIRPAL